jgi:hypothetical protein
LNQFEKGKVNKKSGLTKHSITQEYFSSFIFIRRSSLNKKEFSKAFEDKIYLVNKINLKVEQNNWGLIKLIMI